VYNFDVAQLLSWGYWDLLLLVFLGVIVVWQYLSLKYKFTETDAIIRNSFLIHTEFKLPYSKVSLLSSKVTFWSRPFNGVRLQIESEAKSVLNRRRSSDIVIITNKEIAGKLFYQIKCSIRPQKQTRTVSYRNPRSMLIIFSVLFSSAFSGAIYLFILLYQSADIIGETLGIYYRQLIGDVTTFARSIIDGISGGMVILIVLVIGGWLYSFLSNILRLQNYRLTMKSNYIEIKGGYFSRWSYHINRDYVNYTDIRQNFIMKIFGLYNINIGCTGYGRIRGEIPVFIPITELPKNGAVLEMFLPGLKNELEHSKPQCPTARCAFFRLTVIPFSLILLFAAGYYMLITSSTIFDRLYLFLLIMSEIPSFIFLIVCIIEWRVGGISHNIGNGHYIVYCRKRLSIHMVVISERKVCTIRKKRTFFNRKKKTCDVTIITCGEKGIKHSAKSVNIHDFDII
jgi:uncharacterized membrane protein YdbT with pleckstrin-like domain